MPLEITGVVPDPSKKIQFIGTSQWGHMPVALLVEPENLDPAQTVISEKDFKAYSLGQLQLRLFSMIAFAQNAVLVPEQIADAITEYRTAFEAVRDQVRQQSASLESERIQQLVFNESRTDARDIVVVQPDVGELDPRVFYFSGLHRSESGPKAAFLNTACIGPNRAGLDIVSIEPVPVVVHLLGRMGVINGMADIEKDPEAWGADHLAIARTRRELSRGLMWLNRQAMLPDSAPVPRTVRISGNGRTRPAALTR